MKIHEREFIMLAAEQEISEALCAIMSRHDLTTAEHLQAINGAYSKYLGSLLRHLVIEERKNQRDGKNENRKRT